MCKPLLPDNPTDQQWKDYFFAFEKWEAEELNKAQLQADEREERIMALNKRRDEEGITLQELLEKHLNHYDETWKDVRWSTLSKKSLTEKYLSHEDPPYPFYIWTAKYVYGLTYENYVIRMPRQLQLHAPEEYL